ncbi:hypothetical protein D9611_008828 [Ephemerocybe angulata]|uniref:Transcription elongation factor S-II n=1 Tax=Ephemerocybe angulata TaxID=980116 RepID=A0A8H5FCH2_9AGAR|nr:hypothetical protein D9611_008828 [Tulosesus angulatus]
MCDVVELKKNVKRLQAATTEKNDEDILSILNILKTEFSITEQILRESKAGLAVGKLRQYESTKVSNAAKELVKKWKTAVEKLKPPKAATPKPSAINTSVATAASGSTSKAGGGGGATPATPGGSGPPRTAKSDGVSGNVGDKVRDKCMELIYDALASDSTARTSVPLLPPSPSPSPLPRSLPSPVLPPPPTLLPPLPYNITAGLTSPSPFLPFPAASDLISKRALAVESAVFKSHSSSTAGDYKNKIRSLFVNLKAQNNPELRESVVSGETSAERLATMSSEDMASEEHKAKLKKIKEENLFQSLSAQETEAETEAFQCGRCKQRKCRYRQAQTRSADEPMTTFVTCTVCGNRWKFS